VIYVKFQCNAENYNSSSVNKNVILIEDKQKRVLAQIKLKFYLQNKCISVKLCKSFEILKIFIKNWELSLLYLLIAFLLELLLWTSLIFELLLSQALNAANFFVIFCAFNWDLK